MLGIRHAIYNGTIICHNPVNRMKKPHQYLVGARYGFIDKMCIVHIIMELKCPTF